ncbi:MAG TPA: imidazoleglycerol-phosphate dehydratase HisB [Epulopiscium sp.]|nr:imidazoleglycerol-phosphate dehydratase HisB [Candidatus Epulonipiscium sp.]
MERKSSVARTTFETDIKMELLIGGRGKSDIDTRIPFLDHMLILFSKHGLFDLTVKVNGDIEVDCHHTIEDTGIVLGQCIAKALGDKKGIRRYGDIMLPMDETLILCALDISGRPYLAFDGAFTVPAVGGYDTEMVEEFFRAVCLGAGINMHIKIMAGKNNHHMIEGIYKAFGRALDVATTLDPRVEGVPSTKGML